MTKTAAFWDGIAEKYAARPVGDEEAYARTLDRVRHWMRPGDRVLEIGCGTGTTALKLADGCAEILGTDISPQMLRIAQERAGDRSDVRFVCAEAAEAGAGERFDVVCTFNLLHLVGDRAAVFEAVRARLETGGLFISKTPCLAGKPLMRGLIWAMRCVGKAPPEVGFVSPAQIGAEIAAAGFEIVETGDYPAKLPNHFIVARAV